MSGHPCQEGDDHAQGHSAGQEDPGREGLSSLSVFPSLNKTWHRMFVLVSHVKVEGFPLGVFLKIKSFCKSTS